MFMGLCLGISGGHEVLDRLALDLQLRLKILPVLVQRLFTLIIKLEKRLCALAKGKIWCNFLMCQGGIGQAAGKKKQTKQYQSDRIGQTDRKVTLSEEKSKKPNITRHDIQMYIYSWKTLILFSLVGIFEHKPSFC